MHRFCGHCRELCLLCSCEGDPSAGRDCIFCNLPPPGAGSDKVEAAADSKTLQHLLLRWASLVAACKPLRLDAHQFLQAEGERVVGTLIAERPRLLTMVEQFIAAMSTSDQLPVLINALGGNSALS